VSLKGAAGHFTVRIERRPRGVDQSKCTGCGDCWQACPVRNVPETVPAFAPAAPLGPDDEAQLCEILARHDAAPGRLMPVLQEINAAYGYLPRPLLEHLACRWETRLSEILRVASFYNRFPLEPLGRHVIEVCAGTSCHSRGSRKLLARLEKEIDAAPGQTDKTGRFTLRTVRCLGLCALAPAMKIDGQSFGRVNLGRLPEILEQFA
jgi:NADH-quinone oxidoreductase subunit E